MRRFLLVNRYFHPDESATSQFLTDLARFLANHAPVEVLASRQLLEDANARLPASDTLGAVRIHRLWSTDAGRAWLPGRLLDYLSFLVSVGVWLLLHARRGDVVVAKTDPPMLGVVTTLVTLGRDVRRVQWLQDLYPETAIRLGVLSSSGLAARVLRSLRDWSLRRSDLIVTVSAGMLDYLRKAAGSAAVVHIPNWADDFAGPEDKASSDQRLVLGYSGNLGRAHPIEGLIALAEAEVPPQIDFLFTGGGAHHERLRDHVRSLGQVNWTFLPYQPRERVGELLRRADIHLVLLDPRVEKFIYPSKVYGILSAGRPILHLGDPDGELARLLREAGCGWSLPPHDSRAIVALLDGLRRDPVRIREAGRNARAVYEARFARLKALEQWDDALERV